MSETTVALVPSPDATAIAAEANQYVIAAQELTVTTDEHRVFALVTAKALRSMSRKITDHFEPSRKALDRAKKEILAARDALVLPLETAIGVIDKKCEAFERIERAKAEAERLRLEAEALARQEAQRMMDAALAESEEEAEDVLTETLPAPVVFVPPPVAKVEGVSESFTWDVEVDDKAAFLAAISAVPMLYYLAEPNLVALKSLCRQKDGDLGIAGVRTFKVAHRRFAR